MLKSTKGKSSSRSRIGQEIKDEKLEEIIAEKRNTQKFAHFVTILHVLSKETRGNQTFILSEIHRLAIDDKGNRKWNAVSKTAYPGICDDLKKQKLIKREPRRSKTSICITESGKKFLLGVKELVKNSRAKDIDAWAMIGLPGFLD